jgi:hypothetical protein
VKNIFSDLGRNRKWSVREQIAEDNKLFESECVKLHKEEIQNMNASPNITSMNK